MNGTAVNFTCFFSEDTEIFQWRSNGSTAAQAAERLTELL